MFGPVHEQYTELIKPNFYQSMQLERGEVVDVDSYLGNSTSTFAHYNYFHFAKVKDIALTKLCKLDRIANLVTPEST